MLKFTQMHIEQVPVEQLKPSEYNPRQWTDKERKDLLNSLKEFDFVEPLVVNKYKGRENIVISGHFRLMVAKELGRKTVPVFYVELPEPKERELNIRMNKSGGSFDFDKLANEFNVEELLEFGFDEKEFGIGKAIENEITGPLELGNKCPKCGYEY